MKAEVFKEDAYLKENNGVSYPFFTVMRARSFKAG